MHYLRCLIFSQEAIVYKDALKTAPDCFMKKKGHHSGIDPATQRTNDFSSPNPLPQGTAGLLQKRFHRPRLRTSTNMKEKILDQIESSLGMHHLWMKLKSIDSTLGLFHCCIGGILRIGNGVESRRQCLDG